MYQVYQTIKYCFWDKRTGQWYGWFLSEEELIWKIRNVVYGYAPFEWGHCLDNIPSLIKQCGWDVTEPQYIITASEERELSDADIRRMRAESRFIYIEDSLGRRVLPKDLSCCQYDALSKTWRISDLASRCPVRLRKRKYRKKIQKNKFRFRIDPVPGIHNYRRHCGRRIRYKGTYLALFHPDCLEYGIKGYRTKKVVDPWDIEPFEPKTRSWKDTRKCKHQWEKNAA